MARRWALGLLALLPFVPTAPAEAATVHRIHFPVETAVRFRSGFGDDRDGGARRHLGNDIMGTRLQRILAATDGTVTRAAIDSGNAGNYLVIKAPDGWQTKYMHLNNDTPGTDDGANPAAWRFAPGIRVGAKVRAGQFIAYLGDSGNAETTAPHLHFEVHAPSGVVDPWPSLRRAAAIPTGTYCSPASNPRSRPDSSTADAVSLVPAPGPVAAGTGGWWSVTPKGAVIATGAPHLGDLAGRGLTIVDLAARPDGYWLLGADGGVFTFGGAPFLGSTGGRTLNRPVVGMASTPTGAGYWLVASDGGIFTFGDAGFHGSAGAQKLNEPIVDLVPTPSGRGYWLLARDGGVFAFGDAGWFGSVPGTGSCGPMVAGSILASPSGAGYWIQATDGRVWSFGDAAEVTPAGGTRLLAAAR